MADKGHVQNVPDTTEPSAESIPTRASSGPISRRAQTHGNELLEATASAVQSNRKGSFTRQRRGSDNTKVKAKEARAKEKERGRDKEKESESKEKRSTKKDVKDKTKERARDAREKEKSKDHSKESREKAKSKERLRDRSNRGRGSVGHDDDRADRGAKIEKGDRGSRVDKADKSERVEKEKERSERRREKSRSSSNGSTGSNGKGSPGMEDVGKDGGGDTRKEAASEPADTSRVSGDSASGGRMPVRRMASVPAAGNDEINWMERDVPQRQKVARKASKSLSSEELLDLVVKARIEDQEAAMKVTMSLEGSGGRKSRKKAISSQAHERRKNSRSTQLNHSDVVGSVVRQSSLVKAMEQEKLVREKEKRKEITHLLSATASLPRIHRHSKMSQVVLPDVEASDAFEQAVIHEKFGLIDAICCSDADIAYGGSPELLRSVMTVLQYEDRLEEFIKWLLERELLETPSSSLAFRGVSIASTFFAAYFFSESRTYIKETVLPLVTHVCSIDRSWELNPAVVGDDVNVKENMERLTTLFEGFLDKVFSKQQKMPHSVTRLFLHTKNLIANQWEDEVVDAGRMLLGFFFLRFLCPVIIAPDRFDLSSTSPEPSARRGLVLISKLLQNLANGTEFDFSKEVFMCGFNEVLAKYRGNLEQFAEEIVTIDQAGDVPKVAEAADITPAMRHKAIQQIFSYVQANFAAVYMLVDDDIIAGILAREFPGEAKARLDQIEVEDKEPRSRSPKRKPISKGLSLDPAELPAKKKSAKKRDRVPPPPESPNEDSEITAHVAVLKELLRNETQKRCAVEAELESAHKRIAELELQLLDLVKK